MPATPATAKQNASQTMKITTPQPIQKADVLLKADHRKVEGLFAQYEKTEDAEEKKKLAHQICKELIVHTKLEEELFYPACRQNGVEDDMLNEAQVEHDGAKVMIAELIEGSPDDEFYDAKVTVLSEYIKHHVGEEEKPRNGIFAKAQKAGVDMAGLGQRLAARKQQLMPATDENNLELPQPRSLHPQQLRNQENSMARYSDDRDRDDRGRFTSDDDDNRGRNQSSGSGRGGYSSRSRDDDDERRGGYSSRGGNGNKERDERGRFTSEDDDGRNGGRGSSRGGYSSRGRDDEDDDRRSGSSEGRGWYGDSRGHSQAAREGWEDRGSSRSRDYEDDRGGRNMRDEQTGGRYGRGSSDRDRDERGRFTSDDDDGRGRNQYSSSRSRDYDEDDDQGSRSRQSSRGGSQEGHGGWFGDSKGHAAAARRGWQHRD